MMLSKRNRRGLLGLIFICLFIAITPRILNAMFSVDEPIISFEELQKVHIDLSTKKSNSKKRSKSFFKSRYSAPRVKFNPKDYSLSEWMKLGLSEKQSNIVIKFTERGISNEGELKRIFVIPDELFNLIKDSVIYSTKEYKNQKEEASFERKIENVDINNCNESDLRNLPGIGEYFAKKIILYRDQLGGFHTTNQLLEVWKFDREKFDKISPYLTRSNKILKLDVNEASLDELKQHPYISYAVANSIVKMRLQNNYKSIEDIKRSKLIDEELFEKIKPYLDCK